MLPSREIRVLEELDKSKRTRSSLNRQIGSGNSNRSVTYHIDDKENNMKKRGLVKEAIGVIQKEDGRTQRVPMIAITEKGKQCLQNPNDSKCKLPKNNPS